MAVAFLTSNVHLAFADKVAKSARASLAELRFDDARETAIQGLEEGTRGPSELAELYMVLGQIAASLGEDAEAESYFQAALSLSDSIALPEGVSPKLSEPFEQAKASLEERAPIEVFSEVDADGLLSVQISSDPAELVGGVEARYQDGGEEHRKRARGIGTLRLQLSPTATDVHVVLIDPHGNRLTKVIAVAPDKVTVEVPTTPKKQSASGGKAFHTRWPLYAGLAVGSVAAGAYFGSVSRSKSDELADLEDGTEFSAAQALEDDARRNALYANISFAAALAFAAGSTWLFLRNDDSPGNAKAAFMPTLNQEQFGFAAQVEF